MGCAESRPDKKPSSSSPSSATPSLREQQAPPSYFPEDEELARSRSQMLSAAMGRSSGRTSAESSLRLTTQHERLILELLPFKDSTEFQAWLNGDYVRGSWDEFYRDFLSSNLQSPEPEKAKVAQAAREAINSRTAKFAAYHPVKESWSAEDHHVRFIVTVVADNMLRGGVWSESDWKKRGLDIAKAVYEVLSYLRAVDVRVEQLHVQAQSSQGAPPSYEGY